MCITPNPVCASYCISNIIFIPPSLPLVIHSVRYMHAYKHAFIDTGLTVVVIFTQEVGATHSETALLHADGSYAASLT